MLSEEGILGVKFLLITASAGIFFFLATLHCATLVSLVVAHRLSCP